MNTTDYPAPCRIVDEHGHPYRLQIRSPATPDATTGQLVAIADGNPTAQPVELTRDGVHLADIDAELRRWDDWYSVIRSGDDGFSTELNLTEVQRRFRNAGLHSSADES